MSTSPTKSNRTVIALCLASLLCVALLIWALKLNGEVSDLQAENAKFPALEAAAQKAKAEAAKSRAQTASLQAQAKDTAPTPTVDTTAGPDSTAKSENKRNLNPDELAAIMKNPAMHAIMGAQTAAMVKLTYGDLMNKLQLSPEERDYFQNLLAEKQMNLIGLGTQLMNPSLSADDRAAIVLQLHQGVAADNTKIQTFLNSDTDYAAYQTYSTQEPDRMEVGMLESSATGPDALDPATSDALSNMLNDTRTSFPFTVDFYNQANFVNAQLLTAPNVDKFLTEQEQYQAQAAEKAATVLTPSQLEAFKQNQIAVHQMAKMQLDRILQMSGGGGGQ
jgi:hypothetical protein